MFSSQRLQNELRGIRCQYLRLRWLFFAIPRPFFFWKEVKTTIPLQMKNLIKNTTMKNLTQKTISSVTPAIRITRGLLLLPLALVVLTASLAFAPMALAASRHAASPVGAIMNTSPLYSPNQSQTRRSFSALALPFLSPGFALSSVTTGVEENRPGHTSLPSSLNTPQ